MTFSATGADPDHGDSPLTYAWRFDDGASAAGAVVRHAFAHHGRHTGAVTVTDPTGLTATAAVSVPVSDRTPPVLSRLSARGRTFHFRLSEGARVTLTLRRIGRHRRVGPSLGTVSHTLDGGARTLALPRRLRHRLVGTGRFRATLVPVDAAHNRGRAKALSIRVRH